MNSLPADQRGGGAGMLNTFQNSASVLSIGVFFTIITLGLAATLPSRAVQRARRAGRARGAGARGRGAAADRAAVRRFLGFNPIQQLLPVGRRRARLGLAVRAT